MVFVSSAAPAIDITNHLRGAGVPLGCGSVVSRLGTRVFSLSLSPFVHPPHALAPTLARSLLWSIGLAVDPVHARALLRSSTVTATTLTKEVHSRLQKIANSGVTLSSGRVSWGSDQSREWLVRVSASGSVSDLLSGLEYLDGDHRALVLKTSALIPTVLSYVGVSCGSSLVSSLRRSLFAKKCLCSATLFTHTVFSRRSPLPAAAPAGAPPAMHHHAAAAAAPPPPHRPLAAAAELAAGPADAAAALVPQVPAPSIAVPVAVAAPGPPYVRTLRLPCARPLR